MQKVATYRPLEMAAKNRETVLRNAYSRRPADSAGVDGEVKAFVIPAEQHDPLTMDKMVNKLLGQGIDGGAGPRVTSCTRAGSTAPGSYVVSMAQPKRGLIRYVLGQTYYPDNTFTRNRDGTPMRPYDLSTDNFAEFMGIRVDPVETPVEADLRVVDGWVDPDGTATRGSFGYVLDGRLNDSFHAMNLLFAAGASLRRVDRDGMGVKAGDFVVESGVSEGGAARIAAETGVDFLALNQDVSAVSSPLEKQRIGMYQRYMGGNMDEGWTRLMLEDFAFEYTSLMDEEILAGDLHEDWDVIILPSDSKGMMTGIRGGDGGGGYGRGPDPSSIPPDYRSGFGQEGVQALEAFVENGGTLVTFAQAGELAIEEFGLPVRNAVAGMWGNDFWAPGSTLKVKVDNTDPHALGMPEDALALFLSGGQVYETVSGPASEGVKRIVTYVDRNILQSGWLLGEEAIANKAAAVSVRHGEGTVYLIGFRAQHRHQTHGTYKLVFNALVGGPE